MESSDVVVVGAGLSGLTAARDVAAAGRSVIVLEARDRVAGRNLGGHLVNGVSVEMGGQWIGNTQTEALKLVADLGLETFTTYDDGDSVSLYRGATTRYTDLSFGLPDASASEIVRMKAALDDLSETVSLSSPWTTPQAAEIDRLTLDEWLRANTDDEGALAFWDTIVPGVFAALPNALSLLHFLFYAKSGSMLDTLLTTTGGAQEHRVVGGTHQISERLAAGLGDGVVRLNSPVHTIAHDYRGLEISFDGGAVRAVHGIVTLPPTLAGRLRYRPALPSSRDLLTQQVPMGSVIKVQVAYPTPFWREAGLNGNAFSLDDEMSITLDNSPLSGECGVLVGFFEGTHARNAARWTAEQRKAATISMMVKAFGPAAADPLDYLEQDWTAEEYTRGCYGGRLGAGVWTQYGTDLAEPIGRLHWAGAETSDVWNGYMDGAIRSGRRAAAEVLARLDSE